jgi:large subunit ribosomal protein L5
VGEAKTNTALLDAATDQLGVITGQKPTIRRARKSIANFKLREGMAVGVKVTLRGDRMWEMLDRLQSIAIPRIRDFRGLNPRSFDGRGNYSRGLREPIIFPEIDYDSIDEVRGLDVTITTSARSDEEGFELLRLMGMPFRTDDRAAAAAKPAEAPAPPAEEEPVEAQDEAPAEAQDEAPAEAQSEEPVEAQAEEPAAEPEEAPETAEEPVAEETAEEPESEEA